MDRGAVRSAMIETAGRALEAAGPAGPADRAGPGRPASARSGHDPVLRDQAGCAQDSQDPSSRARTDPGLMARGRTAPAPAVRDPEARARSERIAGRAATSGGTRTTAVNRDRGAAPTEIRGSTGVGASTTVAPATGRPNATRETNVDLVSRAFPDLDRSIDRRLDLDPMDARGRPVRRATNSRPDIPMTAASRRVTTVASRLAIGRKGATAGAIGTAALPCPATAVSADRCHLRPR